MIVILDYDMGNVGSIQNMIRKIGIKDIKISRDPVDVKAADKLILPGVGAFDTGMQKLEEYGLSDLIRHHALVERKPILGICLGMQLLGVSSEEGSLPGLGLVPFYCKRFTLSKDSTLKIPHMGWDRTQVAAQSPLTKGLEEKQRYYYVHSFHVVCDHPENVLMTCNYEYIFAAAVHSDNIYGVQFHPEKSHMYGMKLLKNFAEEC